MLWSVNAAGGYLYSDNLSAYLRIQNLPLVKFRQLADVTDTDANGTPLVGKNNGDFWHWNILSKLKKKGGPIGETEKMPATSSTITQNMGKIIEYGNSVNYTRLLDDLSEQPIKTIIDKQLKIDVAETFDVAVWQEFDKTPLRIAPTSGTSTTAITAYESKADFITGAITNNVALGAGHIEPIATYMKERNIPAFENGDYLAIARPSTFLTLKADLEAKHLYTETGLGRLINGEMGRYRGVRFIEQTHIVKGGATDSTTYDPQNEVADAWNNGKSDWCYFMGADTVTEGVAVLEELRGKIPGEYGRDRGLAWMALIGYSLTHTAAFDARIVKWDSAA